MKPAKIYYAHPISMYETPLEQEDLDMLKRLHPLAIIYNPATDLKSNKGYKKYGMEYFYKIIDDCVYLYFRSFSNGKIGAGVWGEIKRAKSVHCEVIEIPTLSKDRKLSIEDTREYLKHDGKR